MIDPAHSETINTAAADSTVSVEQPAPAAASTVAIDIKELLVQLAETVAPKAAAQAQPLIVASLAQALEQQKPGLVAAAVEQVSAQVAEEVVAHKAELEQRLLANHAALQADLDRALRDAHVPPKIHAIIDTVVVGVPSALGLVTYMLSIAGDRQMSPALSIGLVVAALVLWTVLTVTRTLAPVPTA